VGIFVQVLVENVSLVQELLSS